MATSGVIDRDGVRLVHDCNRQAWLRDRGLDVTVEQLTDTIAAPLRGLVGLVTCPTLVVLDDAGHCPQLTAPDRVDALLDDFLRRFA